MSDRREMLLREYAEVAGNFRLLTDIRFKLLAFLPLAAGAAAAVVGSAVASLPALVFALFGLAVTLGLVTYNARNDQLYGTLVARAAAIERFLDDPDGAFANRPQPWLTLRAVRWRVDHGTGVATVYYASIALWMVVAADSGVRFVDDLVAGAVPPPPWVRPAAAGAAVVVTLLGALLVRWRRRTTQRRLRVGARAAVLAVLDRDLAGLDDEAENALTALGGDDVRARLAYLGALPREDAAFYVRPGAGVWSAAQTVAYLTDFAPEWLYDCATSRRAAVGPEAGDEAAASEATEGDPNPGALADARHPLR